MPCWGASKAPPGGPGAEKRARKRLERPLARLFGFASGRATHHRPQAGDARGSVALFAVVVDRLWTQERDRIELSGGTGNFLKGATELLSCSRARRR